MNTKYSHDEESYFREISHIIWTKGDSISRAFYVLFLLGFILPFLYIVLFGLDFPFEVFLSYLIACSLVLLVMDPGLDGCINIDVINEFIKRDYLFSGDKQAAIDHYNEMIRYIRKYGQHNRVPGQLSSPILAWAIFYINLFCSVNIGFWLIPFVGGWTPVVLLFVLIIPFILLLRTVLAMSTRRYLTVAQQRGFRLKELRDIIHYKPLSTSGMKSKRGQETEHNNRWSLVFISLLIIGCVIWSIGAYIWYHNETYYLLAILLILFGTSVEGFAIFLHIKRRKQISQCLSNDVDNNMSI